MLRRQDASQRVLASATALFAAHGYAETSMAMIAGEADVSVGTLYNLFGNKETLYVRLIELKAGAIAERLNDALGRGETAHQRLQAFLEEKLAAFREEAVFIRLYYQVNAHARFSLRASLPDEAARLYESTTIALADLLRGAIAFGIFDSTIEPLRAAICYQAMTTELFLLHLDNPRRHPADVVLREAAALARTALPSGDDRCTPGPRTSRKESRT